jgi:organic hydroperoxide reductase OsmC/OhrA
MLWMLHLCADAGISVTAYSDQACGVMTEDPDGSGRFTEVTLHPVMTITDHARIEETAALHAKAHELCFIANSVNFPVRCPSPVVTAPC